MFKTKKYANYRKDAEAVSRILWYLFSTSLFSNRGKAPASAGAFSAFWKRYMI